MYNRYELMDAIEAATLNIKTAKAQLRRLEKARSIIDDIMHDNLFGFDGATGDVLGAYGIVCTMEEVIETSTANIKKYKKMLKLLDQMEELDKT